MDGAFKIFFNERHHEERPGNIRVGQSSSRAFGVSRSKVALPHSCPFYDTVIASEGCKVNFYAKFYACYVLLNLYPRVDISCLPPRLVKPIVVRFNIGWPWANICNATNWWFPKAAKNRLVVFKLIIIQTHDGRHHSSLASFHWIYHTP